MHIDETGEKDKEMSEWEKWLFKILFSLKRNLKN